MSRGSESNGHAGKPTGIENRAVSGKCPESNGHEYLWIGGSFLNGYSRAEVLSKKQKDGGKRTVVCLLNEPCWPDLDRYRQAYQILVVMRDNKLI